MCETCGNLKYILGISLSPYENALVGVSRIKTRTPIFLLIAYIQKIHIATKIGPSGNLISPSGYLTGPSSYLNGPSSYLTGPSSYLIGPYGNQAGPSGNLNGPTGNLTYPSGNNL